MKNQTHQACLNALGKRKIPPSAKKINPGLQSTRSCPPPCTTPSPGSPLAEERGAQPSAEGNVPGRWGASVSSLAEVAPYWAGAGMGRWGKEWGSLTPGPGSLTSEARPVMAPEQRSSQQQCGVARGVGFPRREGRASPRVLSVAVGRLVAKLPVVVSAVALDVDAAHAVPQFKGLLVFTRGSLAAAPACGLQQGVVRDTGALVE